jgi:hypothetical protein
VLCTPANINDVIAKYVPRDATAVEPAPLPAAAPVAASQAAAPAGAAPAQKKARPTGPMTPEEQKDRQNYAIVTFNLTVMALMGLLWYGMGRGMLFSAAIALPLAAAAASVVWKMKSR